MNIQQFVLKFSFLFVFLFVGSAYFFAEQAFITAQLTDSSFTSLKVANAQTIPVVDLSELDFRVAVEATTVAPGEVILFRLQITNTSTYTLAPTALITTPPDNTSFSLAESSDGWLQSGTESTPCADGHPAGYTCFLTLDRLSAGETAEAIFAVVIDPDFPFDGERISLLANIYPADQQPLAPNPPPPATGQDDPTLNPAGTIDHTIFLPLFN